MTVEKLSWHFKCAFQSTHPRRVWPDVLVLDEIGIKFQSTHPRRVWRAGLVWFETDKLCFNPHTHAGCDYTFNNWRSGWVRFNPHTHAGCDPDVLVLDEIGIKFQSTHPRRVWPTAGVIADKDKVSIHTPTQGVTLYLITYYKSANLIHCYANHHYYSTS